MIEFKWKFFWLRSKLVNQLKPERSSWLLILSYSSIAKIDVHEFKNKNKPSWQYFYFCMKFGQQRIEHTLVYWASMPNANKFFNENDSRFFLVQTDYFHQFGAANRYYIHVPFIFPFPFPCTFTFISTDCMYSLFCNDAVLCLHAHCTYACTMNTLTFV